MNTPPDHALDSEPKAPSWIETILIPKLRSNGNRAQGQLYVPYAEITMVSLFYSLRLIEGDDGVILEGTSSMTVPSPMRGEAAREEQEEFQLSIEEGNIRMMSKRTQEPGEFDIRMMYILYAAAGLRHLLPEGDVVT